MTLWRFQWLPTLVFTLLGGGFGLLLPDINHSNREPFMGAVCGLAIGILVGGFVEKRPKQFSRLPFAFSLRTLLIATTLIAVGLGLIVWAAN